MKSTSHETTHNPVPLSQEEQEEHRGLTSRLWKIRWIVAAYYATNAILLPYLSIYFKSEGYSDAQIGLLLMAGPFFAIFAQPLWGYLSDRTRKTKRIIFFLWILTILSSIGLFTAGSYGTTFIFIVMLYIFVIPSTPLLDSIAIKSSLAAGKSYGSVRMWGSAGFACIAITSGFILSRIGGIQHISYIYWSIWVIALLLLMLLKDEGGVSSRLSLVQLKELMKNKEFLWFLVIVFMIMVPHRMNDGLFTLYLQELGGSDKMAGWSWAFATLGEIPAFALFGNYLYRYHETSLLGLVALLYTVRWILYAWIHDPVVLMLLQFSHMVTFGIFWITAVRYAVRLVPDTMRSTGQALLSAVFLGVAGITGGSAGGWIMNRWNGSAAYLCGAGLTFLAALLLFRLRLKTQP